MVLAGGGMGMAHARPDDTYPMLAQPVGWVPPGDLGDVVEAIVTAQRDHGNRDDRNRARLKYTIETHGIEWLRAQIEERTGRPLAPPVEMPEFHDDAHFGWHEIDGVDTLGLPVPSGKVVGGIRTALRRLVADGTVAELRVTARQDLLLVGATDRDAVERVLRANGVTLASDQSPMRSLAIACPALPTCAKALGEAERVLPGVVDDLEKVLDETGNQGLAVRLNMTGCPNGCARPYGAEIGIVGRTKRNYDVYVGGAEAGDRLAQVLRADVPLADVPTLLRPLLERFADAAKSDASGASDASGSASFGDWCASQDLADLQALLPEPTGRRRGQRVTADEAADAVAAGTADE
jgi:sulfite reductase (ferredoxin)